MGTTITRSISADRDGILAHLEEARAGHAETAAKNGTTVACRNHETGFADGIAFAMGVIRDWKEAGEIKVEQ